MTNGFKNGSYNSKLAFRHHSTTHARSKSELQQDLYKIGGETKCICGCQLSSSCEISEESLFHAAHINPGV